MTNNNEWKGKNIGRFKVIFNGKALMSRDFFFTIITSILIIGITILDLVYA